MAPVGSRPWTGPGAAPSVRRVRAPTTRWLPGSAFLLAVLGTSCVHAEVERFEAEPRLVQAGQSTRLTWQVVGSAVLDAEPPLAGTGPVPAAGTRSFVIQEPTVFQLTVTRSPDDVAFARQEVDVYQAGREEQLVFLTEPAAGRLAARQDLPAAQWGEARIALVENVMDRPLEIAHGERAVRLAPREATKALTPALVAGPWVLHADLLPGEVLGDPTRSPPARLRLRVVLGTSP